MLVAHDLEWRGPIDLLPIISLVSSVLPPLHDFLHLATLPAVNTSINTIALSTSIGPVIIKLRPDWSADSVEYVRRVAMNDLCTPHCKFYRAERNKLLQAS